MSRASAGPANRASKYRPEDDFYVTPPEASRPFIAAAEPWLRGRTIWEPACGAGDLSREMIAAGHSVVSSNLIDRGYGHIGHDFLAVPETDIDCIVTNPPFSLVNNFALHAINLNVEFVALFAKTKFLEGDKRYKTILAPHPPTFVYQFIERIKFYAGDTAREDQPGWNTEAFAWFVWLRGETGEPRIRWLRRGERVDPVS